MTTGESILIAVLTLLMITDLVGNTLVCIVVLCNRSLKTPMNYILVNLAVADMMVALFMAPRHIFLSAFTHPSGETGDYVCKFLTGGNFMWVGGAASSFCLVAIAVERYYAIVYPHMEKGRITRKKLKIIIISCWVYAVIVDIPPFLVINFNPKRHFCTEYWPHVTLAKAYTVLMFNLDFAVPVLLMGILYSKVVYNLWFQRQNVADITQTAVLSSRKKVTKMVLIVTVIYGMSWMPVLTLYMLSYHLPSQFKYASIIHNAAVVFICVNSSINPFIYSFQMRGFKSEIKRLFNFRKVTMVQDIRGMNTSTHYGTTSTFLKTRMTNMTSLTSIRGPIDVKNETSQASSLHISYL
ncbi:neuropeptide FF receptor 2-like [Actinia tenebrosa]|uniref:Neuropeptide FF receptor 2-like n=1 Tax=Actinia tenebrosa TaxID=6105 RepID=A0A6P8HYW9_ACTTE|nr:neuropeptide FF receptor 2-like [Actinia tenebrosa]XP_031557856.1 neuropeptide FF receptor 2-like [Actinia tenebrosa]